MARLARWRLLLALACAALPAGPPGPALAGDDPCPEPNDQAEQACPLGPDATVAGYLDAADDVDRYRFEIGSNQTIRARLANLPGDYALRLEEASGALVIAGGPDGPDRALEAREMPAGVYVLVVSSTAGDASPDQPYSLSLAVRDPAPAAGVQPTPPPATPAEAPPAARPGERPLADLVLRLEDAGELATDGGSTQGAEGGIAWYQVTFKRNPSNPTARRKGPLITINRAYRAPDVAAARALYQRQVGLAFPEADELKLGFVNFGLEQPGALGDEAYAIGACDADKRYDCNGDDPRRHFRVVFRIGNVVETVYTYGYLSGTYFLVALDLAQRAAEHVAH